MVSKVIQAHSQTRVDFHDPLSEGQQQQLLAALETCPVRSTLSKPLDFRRVSDDRA